MVFRIQLNNQDWYSEASSELDPSLPKVSSVAGLPDVPIIRIYGTTADGEKVLAHVHGALPYIYVDYPGPYRVHGPDDNFSPDEAQKWISKLRHSIDYALNASMSRGKTPVEGKMQQYVASVALVKGTPFYGFHVGWKLYCKIYLYSPRHVTHLARLLSSPVIMKRRFQPYEAHIGYLHQFMIDFNLYGCNYIDIDEENVKYRRVYQPEDSDVSDSEDEENAREPRELRGVPYGSRLRESRFPPQSFSGWEVDIQVHHILNRHQVPERQLHQNFGERNVDEDPDNKLLNSLDELWKLHGSHMHSEGIFTASAAREIRPGWLQEKEYREYITNLMRDEKKARGVVKPETIPFTVPAEEHIPTAYQATGYLSIFVQNQKKVQDKAAPAPVIAPQVAVDYEVDLSVMLDMEKEEESDTDKYFDSDDDLFDDYGEEQRGDDTVDPHPQEKDELMDKGENREMQTENLQDIERTDGPPLRDQEVRKEEIPDVNMSDFQFDIEDFGTPDKDLKFSPISKPGKRGHTSSPVHNTKRPRVETSQNHREEANSSLHGQLKPSRDRHLSVSTPTTPKIQISGETSESQKTPRSILHRPSMFSVDSPDGIPPNGVPHGGQSTVSEPRSSRKVRFSQTTPALDRKSSVDIGSFLESFDSPKLSEPSSSQVTAITASSGFHNPDDPLYHERVYRQSFSVTPDTKIMFLGGPPPSTEDAMDSLADVGGVVYQDAYFSNPEDVPENPLEYGGVAYKPISKDLASLPRFDPLEEGEQSSSQAHLPEDDTLRMWEFAEPPPSYEEMEEWLKDNPLPELRTIGARRLKRSKNSSQIEGPTQPNKYGFKYSQTKKAKHHVKAVGDMTIMSLEIHVNTRGTLVPDPEKDPVECFFWCVRYASGGQEIDSGVVTVGFHHDIKRIKRSCNVEVQVENSENDLINTLVYIVREFDPDILCGYEVHSSSWGYIIGRAMSLNETRLTEELSRVKTHGGGRVGKDVDKWGYNKAAAIKVTGRHFINIWRAMRGELALTGYKMENVVFHLLNRRIPHYSYKDLTKWYKSDVPFQLGKVLRYFILRTKLDLEILEKQEYVTRISEQARLIGIDFYSVFSRGSQLKVESLMFRLAKPESYMMMSPNKTQVARQNAIECKPLILEPQSAFYNSPVVVLDFQSLYPSVMIAYNYCYSTCLGRVAGWSKASKLGVTDYYRPPGLLAVCQDDLNVAPNGMVFVKANFRKSLLAKMLSEILDTRVMVKSRMKQPDVDKDLSKKLNSWQLALKLIANVTYGYTSATFSGRMPCVEIADSIVQTGRETLEKAIDIIHSESSWGAEVVYGDTDSLFVHLKGKTRAEAFDIGEAIAARVTALNPKPIKLKFEKVYHPCFLIAMKRYVGHKYESRDQKSPDFDAKGIETVRRDGTPAIQKIVEKTISILFRTADLSQVKEYCIKQWTKIMQEKVSIQDFCFAKEVKLGSYSEGAPPQPGVKLAAERMDRDPRNEPQYGERYPYVVVAGAPDQSVTERSVEVEWLLHSDALALDASYYIRRKLIPPLSRIFNLVGANVLQWYEAMPKYQPLRKIVKHGARKEEVVEVKAATLELFMDQDLNVCPICKEETRQAGTICEKCLERRDESLYEVRRRLADVETKYAHLQAICRSCSGASWAEEVPCDSQDCPVYYSRVRQETRMKSQKQAADPIIQALERPPRRKME